MGQLLERIRKLSRTKSFGSKLLGMKSLGGATLKAMMIRKLSKDFYIVKSGEGLSFTECRYVSFRLLLRL